MAMGRPKAVLVLDAEQREQLESFANSRALPAGQWGACAPQESGFSHAFHAATFSSRYSWCRPSRTEFPTTRQPYGIW